MLFNKTKTLTAIALALALTACSTTANRSATDVRVVAMPTLPPVPSVLLNKPTRPEPPQSGKPDELLRHVVDFGAYVKALEAQLDAWREWVWEMRKEQP